MVPFDAKRQREVAGFKHSSARRRILVTFAVYVVLLVAIALWPDPIDAPIRGRVVEFMRFLRPLGLPELAYRNVEATANIALLMPLGLVIGLVLPIRWSWCAPLTGFACGIVIELTQSAFLPERLATWNDVVLNTVGSAIGAVVGVGVRSFTLWRRSRRGHRLLP